MFAIEEPKAKRQKPNSSSSCGHEYVRNDIHESTTIEGQALISQRRHEAVKLVKRFNTLFACLNKKLHLVLDLGHTLVHTVSIPRLSEAEKYLLEEADSKTREDLWKLKLPNPYLTKFRPFLRNFLKEANELFTLSLYTTGNRFYVKAFLDIIDPTRIYFGDRLITREDSPYAKKTLDLVLAEERGVLIVDDTPSVWTQHTGNLLQISKYKYFRIRGSNSKPHSEKKTDDSESLVDLLKFTVNSLEAGKTWRTRM